MGRRCGRGASWISWWHASLRRPDDRVVGTRTHRSRPAGGSGDGGGGVCLVGHRDRPISSCGRRKCRRATGNASSPISTRALQRIRDRATATSRSFGDRGAVAKSAARHGPGGSEGRSAVHQQRCAGRATMRGDRGVGIWLDPALRKAEIFAATSRFKIPCAPVRDLEEVMNDPHMHGRGMLEVDRSL